MGYRMLSKKDNGIKKLILELGCKKYGADSNVI